MAPDFEIFQEIEIMRMILFFLLDLRLSAVGTPELRIAADDPYPDIEDVHSSRIKDCDPPPRSWLRCIFEDYTQSNLARMKLGWRKTKPGYPT